MLVCRHSGEECSLWLQLGTMLGTRKTVVGTWSEVMYASVSLRQCVMCREMRDTYDDRCFFGNYSSAKAFVELRVVADMWGELASIGQAHDGLANKSCTV